MRKTVLLIIVLTIFAKVIGFGREIVLSYYFGATSISDIYVIALTIPSIILSFIGNGLSVSFIPIFSEIESKNGEIQSMNYMNNLLNVLLIVSVIGTALGLIFVEQLVKIFASGFHGETLEMAVTFTRISLIGILFTTLIYVFIGYLHIRNNYVIPALISLPLNITMIIFIVLAADIDTKFLAYGIVIASMAQLAFLLIPAVKAGFRYEKKLNFCDENIKKMLVLSIPVIIGVAIYDINKLVDRTLASRVVEGGIAALNYSQRLNGFVQGIFMTSITTAIYPSISRMASQNRLEELKKTISESIIWLIIMVVPITIGAMIFSEKIVILLFGRGAFDENAIMLTSSSLYFYSIGMCGVGIREILSRPFYAMHNTKIPMINSGFGMLINIVLSLVLVQQMGVGGLALATSLAAIITGTMMFVSLRKKIGTFGTKNILITTLKIILAAITMGLFAIFSNNFFSKIVGENSAFIITIIISAVIYSITITLMKIPELEQMIVAIKTKVRTLGSRK